MQRKAVWILCLLMFLVFISPKIVMGAEGPPDNCKYPLLHKELHSLRPYPAIPCNPRLEDLALFCGNNLVLKETIVRNKNQANSCQTLPNGNSLCQFTVRQENPIAIKLRDADLPIMGNTELVANSRGATEQLDDAEKVNEYASWYLSGLHGRAEYTYPSVSDPKDMQDAVSYTGPLNKLLAWDSQVRLRANTVAKSVNSPNEDDPLDSTRHNQIVACTYGVNIKVPTISYIRLRNFRVPFFVNWFNLKDHEIGGIPAPCYNEKIKELVKIEHKISEWVGHIPPMMADKNADGTPKYNTLIEYRKALQEWRGKACALVELPEHFNVGFTQIEFPDFLQGKQFLFCGENPFKPNYYSQMFHYIPYSSTEDRKGLVEIKTFDVQPEGGDDVVISEVVLENQKPATLFFAHMEEVAELSKILQQTFRPQEIDDNTQIGKNIYHKGSDYCDLAQIRTNPGDSLHAGEITGVLKYTAEFSCEFEPPPPPDSSPIAATSLCRSIVGTGAVCAPSNWSCGINYGSLDCPSGYNCGRNCSPPPPPVQECSKDVFVNLKMETKTPLANEVWSRTVAGPQSIFRHIFPKVGEGGPILSLLDIPAATKVTYTSSNPLVIVKAGNPSNQRSGESAELYFPHIGGVSEYFLKGIQTMLRPKGYGENIASGPAVPNFISSGEVCIQPPPPDDAAGAGACQIGVGYCSPSRLMPYVGNDATKARQASIICNAESGGNPHVINCKCLSGLADDYSIGLFQINLPYHCPAAFSSHTHNPPSCIIGDENLLLECQTRYLNYEENYKKMQELSNSGNYWGHWSVYKLPNARGGCQEQILAQ